MIQKSARKPSSDPVQEKLRESKAIWNKEISTFVNNLIHFKKTMNGWPSKFYMQRSKIQEPIPADPATIIGSLAGDFNDLAQKGNSIITQQLDYAKTRKKRQQPNTSPTTETSNLSNQLSIFETKYELIAEGSNIYTRFFARLLNPAIGGSEAARIRKYRMSMLTSAIDTSRDLSKLQNAIVGSSSESIFTSSKLLSKIENNWSFLRQGFFTYKASMPKKVRNSGGVIGVKPEENTNVNTEEASSVSDEVVAESKLAIDDFMKFGAQFLDINMKDINTLLKGSIKLNIIEKRNLAPKILESYKKIISEANEKFPIKGNSLKEIYNNNITSFNKEASDIKIFAQNALSRWYGKIKHQLDPFDKTSSSRLEIYKLSTENKNRIDDIMNSLEKEMSVETLEPLINKVGESLFTTREIMRGLDSTIRGQGFDRPFIDMLEGGKVTEHGTGMSETEKVHLKKMLENKRLRDLSNLYRK